MTRSSEAKFKRTRHGGKTRFQATQIKECQERVSRFKNMEMSKSQKRPRAPGS